MKQAWARSGSCTPISDSTLSSECHILVSWGLGKSFKVEFFFAKPRAGGLGSKRWQVQAVDIPGSSIEKSSLSRLALASNSTSGFNFGNRPMRSACLGLVTCSLVHQRMRYYSSTAVRSPVCAISSPGRGQSFGEGEQIHTATAHMGTITQLDTTPFGPSVQAFPSDSRDP